MQMKNKQTYNLAGAFFDEIYSGDKLKKTNTAIKNAKFIALLLKLASNPSDRPNKVAPSKVFGWEPKNRKWSPKISISKLKKFILLSINENRTNRRFAGRQLTHQKA